MTAVKNRVLISIYIYVWPYDKKNDRHDKTVTRIGIINIVFCGYTNTLIHVDMPSRCETIYTMSGPKAVAKLTHTAYNLLKLAWADIQQLVNHVHI